MPLFAVMFHTCVKLKALRSLAWRSSQNLRSISNKHLTLRRYPRSIIEETIDAFRTCEGL
jgi:hypothetical protein